MTAPSRADRQAPLIFCLLAALCLLVATQPCRADTKVEALVIGNNEPPSAPLGADDPGLRRLEFADDDAVAFYDLIADAADDVELLTVMDRPTQKLYPAVASIAQPPTQEALRRAIAALRVRIEQQQRAHNSVVLFVFFSGHGVLESGVPALALLDGGITQRSLYDSILAQLPADTVHLIVDACHAESVVRPRDVEAQAVKVEPADAQAFLSRTTLSRFPQVGAILAAASTTQSQEWDVLGHGVFTHELLSALRGGADVNHDGRIEYSELYAFLSAANRGVKDERAHLTVVARPPSLDRRAPIFDRAWLPKARISRLAGIPAQSELVELEDDSGRRLASLRSEQDFQADLLVPSDRTVFVRTRNREARFISRAGESVAYSALAFRKPRERARGAMEQALREGLFSSAFGRGYYSGAVDQLPEFMPVEFPTPPRDRSGEPEKAASTARGAALARLVLGGGASRAVAQEFLFSKGVRVGARPIGNSGLLLSLDVLFANGPRVTEWQPALSAGWAWSPSLGGAHAWLGATVGAGALVQKVAGQDSLASGFVGGGPVLGISTDLGRSVGIWGEGQLWERAYRRDARTIAELAPSAWFGASLGL